MPRVTKVTYRKPRTESMPRAWQVDGARPAATRLDGHDRLVELLDELVGVCESSPYLRNGGSTREAERAYADSMGTRQLAEETLDQLGIQYDRTRSDAYVVARANAALESAVHAMSELAETELPPETAALFSASSPAVASARAAFVRAERGVGPGLTREQFLERERNAWRGDTWSAPCAADGTRLDEIDREIERNLRGE